MSLVSYSVPISDKYSQYNQLTNKAFIALVQTIFKPNGSKKKKEQQKEIKLINSNSTHSITLAAHH